MLKEKVQTEIQVLPELEELVVLKALEIQVMLEEVVEEVGEEELLKIQEIQEVQAILLQTVVLPEEMGVLLVVVQETLE